MLEEIRQLLSIKDKNDKYVIDADEVANITGKHRESVYASRKKDCKLDKLAVFEKIKEIVEKASFKEAKLAGDKGGILNGLDGMLKESTRYEISIVEIK